jgi:hypothetical protein
MKSLAHTEVRNETITAINISLYVEEIVQDYEIYLNKSVPKISLY